MPRSKAEAWNPGSILPEQRREPRIPISIRMPRDLYEGLGQYAKRVGANRTYLILECLRRLLDAKGIRKTEVRPLRRVRS